MLIMLWAKICLLIEDLRIFGYMREDMAKVPYQLRSYDMQRFEIWVNLEILISVGIMCSCFLYTFVRALTRNRFVMTIFTANKVRTFYDYRRRAEIATGDGNAPQA